MDFERIGTYDRELTRGSGSYGAGAARAHQQVVGSLPVMEGFEAAQRFADAGRKRRINEAARLWADVIAGREDRVFLQQAMHPTRDVFLHYLQEKYPGLYGNAYDDRGIRTTLRETMSTSDYQALYVDVLDRIYYGYYNIYPIVSKQLVRIHNLRDFRLVSRYLLDGVVEPMTAIDPAAPALQRALSGPVPQNSSTYPTTNTAPIQYAPLLYQSMTSVNWSAIINDDLGIFTDLSQRLAIAGNRSIDKFITSFVVDANGPNANTYKTAYKNQIITANGATTSNPLLTVQGIIDGMSILAAQLDSTGNPIMITGRIKLWYGPAYEGTVNNVMNALSVYVQNQGGTGNAQGFPTQFLNITPWMVSQLDPVMLPYAPIITTAATVKTAQWGLVVDPGSQNRPAWEVGFLTGYDTPQIYQKVPNTMRMGGGVDPMLGDFYSMNQELKIMTVMGGVAIDGRSTVASTGAQV